MHPQRHNSHSFEKGLRRARYRTTRKRKLSGINVRPLSRYLAPRVYIQTGEGAKTLDPWDAYVEFTATRMEELHPQKQHGVTEPHDPWRRLQRNEKREETTSAVSNAGGGELGREKAQTK